MAFLRPGFPPRRPVRAQAAVAGFGTLVSGKKSDFDVVPRQHIGHQGGHFHVASIERQVDRLAGRCITLFFYIIFACGP